MRKFLTALLLTIALLSSGLMTVIAHAEQRRILVFGDSNTWGYVPRADGAATVRYGPDERWSGVLAKALGSDYQIVEDGLNLRTTDLDGTVIPGTIVRADTFNGAAHLPASIVANMPLDLVVVMLGTNDLQARYNRQPVDIAKAAFALAKTVLASKGGIGTVYPAPKVLIVSPVQMATIPFAPVAQRYEGGQEKSKGFSAAFTQEAAETGLPMIDAAVAIGGAVHGADGIHMTPSDHKALATALKPEIERLLNP